MLSNLWRAVSNKAVGSETRQPEKEMTVQTREDVGPAPTHRWKKNQEMRGGKGPGTEPRYHRGGPRREEENEPNPRVSLPLVDKASQTDKEPQERTMEIRELTVIQHCLLVLHQREEDQAIKEREKAREDEMNKEEKEEDKEEELLEERAVKTAKKDTRTKGKIKMTDGTTTESDNDIEMMSTTSRSSIGTEEISMRTAKRATNRWATAIEEETKGGRDRSRTRTRRKADSITTTTIADSDNNVTKKPTMKWSTWSENFKGWESATMNGGEALSKQDSLSCRSPTLSSMQSSEPTSSKQETCLMTTSQPQQLLRRRPALHFMQWCCVCIYVRDESSYNAGRQRVHELARFLDNTTGTRQSAVRSFKSFGRRNNSIPSGPWLWSLEFDDMETANREVAERIIQFADAWTDLGLEFRHDYAPLDATERFVYGAVI